jgi:KDO2-lipid IV(A) lauroyltransferase
MAVPIRKRVKRGLRSLLVRGAIRLLTAAPRRLVLAVGTAVAALAWLVARDTRQKMLASLAVAFPGETPAAREAIARRSMRHLAWLAGEVVTAERDAARIREYVTFRGDAEARLTEVMARGRGVIYVTGHLGNWELMARRVAQQFPSVTIAKAGPDPKLNALIERMRAEGGVATLWREDPKTSRAMIKALRDGKLFGLLIDQDTRVQGVFVPFFGRLAFTPRAAGDLALRFQTPVVAGWVRRRGPKPGDGHEIDFVEIPYDPDAQDGEAESLRITAACTARLEEAIRVRPEEWVWMHERWKTRPPIEASSPDDASSVPKSRELSAG